MKCDLHVHTRASGMCTVPLFDQFCRESYNEPRAVYEVLKQRGMNLVTVTDHDSIDAIEALRKHDDFFLSEEVTCTTPSGTELHMGVYGIREADHLELQARRTDLPSLVAYLSEQQTFFTINHVFSSLTGPRTHSDFAFFEEFFPGIETLNGQMLAFCNSRAAELATRWRKPAIAGSDAHTLSALGLTYTEVPGAGTLGEFLDAVKSGCARTQGVCGNYLKLTRAVLEIGCCMVAEKRWTALLAPLFAAVPAITFVNYFRELAFASKWSRGVSRAPAASELSWLKL